MTDSALTCAYEYHLTGRGLVPKNGGYLILCSLARLHPWIHGRSDIQIAPIRGTNIDEFPQYFKMDSNSKLHIRGINEEESKQLGNCNLNVFKGQVTTSEPSLTYLKPGERMVSKLVIFADVTEESQFRQHFSEKTGVNIDNISLGTKKFIRVKNQVWCGYSVILTGLTAEESLAIQCTGVGKNTSMGCGVFYPR